MTPISPGANCVSRPATDPIAIAKAEGISGTFGAVGHQLPPSHKHQSYMSYQLLGHGAACDFVDRKPEFVAHGKVHFVSRFGATTP
jgi:hypothetical protein